MSKREIIEEIDFESSQKMFDELAEKTAPFWQRVNDNSKAYGAACRAEETELTRWESEGGYSGPNPSYPMTYRDIALNMLKEIGRKFYN
jgi:hypothetical protein